VSQKYQKAYDTSLPIAPEKVFVLEQEHECLSKIIEQVSKDTKEIFN
jgi:hypothetical protein